MSFFGKLIGKGISETAEGIGRASLNLRTAFTGDLPPDAKIALAEMDSKVAEMQGQLNIIEAGKSFFHSGWRPAIGWICVCGLFYDVLMRLLAEGLIGFIFPPADDRLWVLVTSLLGLGALRTVEKFKGVQS